MDGMPGFGGRRGHRGPEDPWTMIVDPDGKYIHLVGDVCEQDPRDFDFNEVVWVRFRDNALDQQRELEAATRPGSCCVPITTENPWVPDFFIPESFRECLHRDGGIEIEQYQGREFVRAVPLATALARFKQSMGMGDSSDEDIERHILRMPLVKLLQLLREMREPSDPPTYMDHFQQTVRRRRGMPGRGPSMHQGAFPPPHGFGGRPMPPRGHGPGGASPYGMPMEEEMGYGIPMDEMMMDEMMMGGMGMDPREMGPMGMDPREMDPRMPPFPPGMRRRRGDPMMPPSPPEMLGRRGMDPRMPPFPPEMLEEMRRRHRRSRHGYRPEFEFDMGF